MATIPIGRYLWERVKQIGVSSVLGVPGDFNLLLLDYIYEVEGLRWVGSANELNAAYSADGYSRVSGHPGVFVTTFGVGELSALNGIAGSYAEQVQSIHIVGQTTRDMQRKRLPIHHCLSNDPDHHVFTRMSQEARVASAELQDPSLAPEQIDATIRTCFIQKRPVYIFVPMDVAQEHVSASLLDTPIDLTFPIDAEKETAAALAIRDALIAAKRPSILVDGLVHRHGAEAEVHDLIQRLHIPVYTTNMGKGIVDDSHNLIVGVYNGVISAPGVAEAFAKSDLTLVLGSVPGDTNTGGYTRRTRWEGCTEITIDPFEVSINDWKMSGIFIRSLIVKIISMLPNQLQGVPALLHSVQTTGSVTAPTTITQKWFWNRFRQFLQPGDIILAEPGTSSHGLYDQSFPPNTSFHTQTYYGSIGWATPATLGAELAIEDMNIRRGTKVPRTILVTGDGSFGLTMQEIGTMITQKKAPIIFLINNSGYTVERIIHGATQPYNDINNLDYSKILPLFSHPKAEASFFRCETPEHVEVALNNLSTERPDHTIFIELIMNKFDVPWRLGAQMALRGPEAVETLSREGFSGWENGKIPEEWSAARNLLQLQQG